MFPYFFRLISFMALKGKVIWGVCKRNQAIISKTVVSGRERVWRNSAFSSILQKEHFLKYFFENVPIFFSGNFFYGLEEEGCMGCLQRKLANYLKNCGQEMQKGLAKFAVFAKRTLFKIFVWNCSSIFFHGFSFIDLNRKVIWGVCKRN